MEFDLDQPLLELSSPRGKDYWTIRHACSGVQIFGATGSGKTSSSGMYLAHRYLQAGFGGLVLTTKRDDLALWRSYCEVTNRLDDLIIIEPNGAHTFNIMDHAAEHGSDELAATDNIVEVLNEVIKASQTQDAGKSEDSFWQSQQENLISQTIDLCKLAYNRVSIQAIFDIVQTIPKGEDAPQTQDGPPKAFQNAFIHARSNVMNKIEVWESMLNEDEKNLLQDETAYETALLDAVPEALLLKFVDGFFIDEFIPLSEKTRSIIQVTFSAFLYRLLREPFHSLFCKYPSTVTPEDCFDGKIVLINLPLKLYHKAGRDCQLACKFLFQRAWERRDVHVNPRPCFLYVDEAQGFITEKDADFLTTARSSHIATVFLTQSLSNYFASMGGQKAQYRVNSLLGNLGTKIFHANTDTETNSMASKLIGEAYFEDQSESTTVAQNFSQTRGRSLKLERIVRPEQFARLLTGGPINGLLVEGYIHRQGQTFANGFNHMKMTFSQSYQP